MTTEQVGGYDAFLTPTLASATFVNHLGVAFDVASACVDGDLQTMCTAAVHAMPESPASDLP